MSDHTDRQHPVRRERDQRGDDAGFPLHRPRKRGTIHIERIDTEDMTPDQYDQAINIFASLINQWQSGTRNPSSDGEMAA